MASITKTTTSTGDTRYRVRYRDETGKSREVWKKRKEDANRVARNVATDIDRGEWIDPQLGRVTLGSYLENWFESRVHLRQTTLETQKSLIRNHLLPELGHRQVSTVRHSDIRNLVSAMQEKGLSPSTIRATHALVYGALDSAANDRLIARNPAAGVDLPRSVAKDMRILDHQEISALAGAVGERFSPTIVLAAYCGLRFGEVAGLRIDAVNVLGRTLSVSASLNEVNGNLVLGPPKTARSRRKLTLPRFVAKHLEDHIAHYPPGESGFLFTGPDGGGLRRSNYRKRVWSPAVAATVGPPCTFHDLRHTSAAILIREGLHPKVIQERMGHASIRTTLDTYGHLFPGLDEAAADALDESVRGVGVGLAG